MYFDVNSHGHFATKDVFSMDIHVGTGGNNTEGI